MSQEHHLEKLNLALEEVSQSDADLVWKEAARDKSMLPVLLRLVVVGGIVSTGSVMLVNTLAKILPPNKTIDVTFADNNFDNWETRILDVGSRISVERDNRSVCVDNGFQNQTSRFELLTEGSFDFPEYGYGLRLVDSLSGHFSLITNELDENLTPQSILRIKEDYEISVERNDENGLLNIIYSGHVGENGFFEYGSIWINESDGRIVLDTLTDLEYGQTTRAEMPIIDGFSGNYAVFLRDVYKYQNGDDIFLGQQLVSVNLTSGVHTVVDEYGKTFRSVVDYGWKNTDLGSRLIYFGESGLNEWRVHIYNPVSEETIFFEVEEFVYDWDLYGDGDFVMRYTKDGRSYILIIYFDEEGQVSSRQEFAVPESYGNVMEIDVCEGNE